MQAREIRPFTALHDDGARYLLARRVGGDYIIGDRRTGLCWVYFDGSTRLRVLLRLLVRGGWSLARLVQLDELREGRKADSWRRMAWEVSHA